jgi:ASC-1-like (ASCH) protein
MSTSRTWVDSSKMIWPQPFYMAHYRKHLSDRWFSHVASGAKCIEGRLNKGDFAAMRPRDTVTWYNDNGDEVRTVITGKDTYPEFRDYLEANGLERCLPGITSIDVGLQIYYDFYSPAEEGTYGVIAISLGLLTD